MSFFNLSHVYYSPDSGVGGVPASAASVSSEMSQLQAALGQNAQIIEAGFKDGLTPLEDKQDEENRLLKQLLDAFGAFPDEFQAAVSVQTESLTGLVGGLGANKGLGADDQLRAQLDQNAAKNLKVTPKEKPTVQDMLKLAPENSMGFLLLYQELMQIRTLLHGQNDPEAKKSKGLGNFFKGLLEGAAGIALLGAGLIIFAGALVIFGGMGLGQWANALVGMTMFALFVLGAIEVAKMVKDHVKDFLEFTLGVVVLSAAFLVFGAAMELAAHIGLTALLAIPTLALFGIFILSAVELSKLIQSNMVGFIEFAVGSLLLAGGLAIFSLALIAAADASKYAMAAIPTLALYGLFIGGIAVIATLMSTTAPLLLAFAASTILLSGGLLLFSFMLDKVAQSGPVVGQALPVLGSMLLVIGGLTLFMAAMAPLGVLAAIGAAALVILSVGMLAFTGLIAVMSLISPEMLASATAMTLASQELIGNHLFNLFVGLGLLSPLIALGGVALIFLSGGMLAWSLVLGLMSLLNPRMADAKAAILASDDMIKSIADFATSMIFQIPVLAIFGVAIGALAFGLGLFADVLRKLSSIKKDGVLPDAMDALQGIMVWLVGTGAKDDTSLLSLLDTFSGGPFSFLGGGSVFDKLKSFGEALRPFSESFLKLAEGIELVAKVGSKEAIDAAQSATMAIVNWLTGDLVSMINGLDSKKLEDLKKFGEALNPLADSMLKLADVMNKTKDVGDKAGAAQVAMRAILAALVGPDGGNGPSIAALINTFATSGGIFGDPIGSIKKFGEAISPLATAMESLVKVFSDVSSKGNVAESAKTTIGSLIGTLGSVLTTDEQLNQTKRFRDSLGVLGDGIKDFVGKAGAGGDKDLLGKLGHSLGYMASLSFALVFDPLLQVLNKNSELERMANSLERIVKSVGAPANGGLFESVGNLLNGGQQGKGQSSGGQPITVARNPLVDQAVVGMYSLMQKWDTQQSQAAPADGKPAEGIPVLAVIGQNGGPKVMGAGGKF